jgi:hypothetical protein
MDFPPPSSPGDWSGNPRHRSGPPPPPPPPSDFLVNSTISQDRTLGLSAIEESNLKSLETTAESLAVRVKFDPENDQSRDYPPRPHPPPPHSPRGPPRVVNLTRSYGHGHRHRRGRSSSSLSSSDSSSDVSSTTAPNAKRNAGLEADPKKILRKELEDEARLGSAPPIEIESHTEWLGADGSEMPSSDLSKAKHKASSNLFYIA